MVELVNHEVMKMKRLSNGYPVWADSTLNKWNKQDIIQQLRQCERMLQEQLKITNNQYKLITKGDINDLA